MFNKIFIFISYSQVWWIVITLVTSPNWQPQKKTWKNVVVKIDLWLFKCNSCNISQSYKNHMHWREKVDQHGGNTWRNILSFTFVFKAWNVENKKVVWVCIMGVHNYRKLQEDQVCLYSWMCMQVVKHQTTILVCLKERKKERETKRGKFKGLEVWKESIILSCVFFLLHFLLLICCNNYFPNFSYECAWKVDVINIVVGVDFLTIFATIFYPKFEELKEFLNLHSY